MALIKCPECGREISDKAVSCPGCGYPIQGNVQADDRSDLEKLVDEIYHKHNGDRVDATVDLANRTGMDRKQALKLMQEKHKSPEVKAENKRIKEKHKQESKQASRELAEAFHRAGEVFGGSKVVKCPKCGSTSISYDTKKLSFGRALVGDALAGASGAILGGLSSKKGYAVCLKCGKRWRI